jgi:hypothetical protein
VTPVIVTGPAPTPAGGPITAGTYDLVSVNVYPGPDAGTNNGQSDQRSTWIISSVTSTSLSLDVIEVSGTTTKRQSGAVTIAGSNVTFAPTCPSGGNGGGSAAYTATTTTFTLFDMGDSGDLRVKVYNKRN